MKNKKISIRTIIIAFLIITIIALISIILNMKNTNIEKQETNKEQLSDTTNSNAYVDMTTHLAEVSAKQQELDNLQNTAGQATATESQILKNYTAYKDGKLITGTMANNGAVSKTLNAGGSYTIPAGYHNGSGKVTANSLASQTSATATAADIASGKTAWVNGELITGSFQNSATIQLLGSLTGNGSIDVSSYSKYENFTISNFIVELVSLPSTNSRRSTSSTYAQGAGATVSKAYDQTTGKLTISGLQQNINNVLEESNTIHYYATQSFKVNVYLIQ